MILILTKSNTEGNTGSTRTIYRVAIRGGKKTNRKKDDRQTAQMHRLRRRF